MSDITIQKTKSPRWKKPGRVTIVNWFWGYFFIAPILIGILVFSIGPVFFSLYMSLTNWTGLTNAKFIGLDNFKQMIGDTVLRQEIFNTFKYTIWTVPVGLCLSIFLAVLMNSIKKGKSFFRVAYFLPVVTMPAAVATVWRYLFNSQYGVINYLFKPFGLNPQWLGDPNYIMTALIVVAIWSEIGYNIIILTAGLQQIPSTYYEAAEIDGASSARKLFRITIPLLSPTIFFLLVTGMMGALRVFDIVFMFTGKVGSSGPTLDAIKTMVFGIYQRGFLFMNMGYASANAVLLFVIILLITLIQFKLQKKLVFYE